MTFSNCTKQIRVNNAEESSKLQEIFGSSVFYSENDWRYDKFDDEHDILIEYDSESGKVLASTNLLLLDAELATKGVEDILEGISDRTEESVKDVFKAVERNLEGQREAQGETIEEE